MIRRTLRAWEVPLIWRWSFGENRTRWTCSGVESTVSEVVGLPGPEVCAMSDWPLIAALVMFALNSRLQPCFVRFSDEWSCHQMFRGASVSVFYKGAIGALYCPRTMELFVRKDWVGEEGRATCTCDACMFRDLRNPRRPALLDTNPSALPTCVCGRGFLWMLQEHARRSDRCIVSRQRLRFPESIRLGISEPYFSATVFAIEASLASPIE